MSKLQDFTTRMNKGEINTGESNENENVHKFNESVVSKNCCFKVKCVPKNIKQSKLLTQKRYCQNLQRTSKHFTIEDLASDG
jgi:hypothetical protein